MTQHVTLEYADSIAVIQRRMIWAQTMYMHIESHLSYTLVSLALSEGIPGVFIASNSIPSIANENPATTGVGDVQAAENYFECFVFKSTAVQLQIHRLVSCLEMVVSVKIYVI